MDGMASPARSRPIRRTELSRAVLHFQVNSKYLPASCIASNLAIQQKHGLCGCHVVARRYRLQPVKVINSALGVARSGEHKPLVSLQHLKP